MRDGGPGGSAQQAPGGASIQELYASWSVFDLFRQTIDQAPAEWLVIFNIARKLMAGEIISGVELPQSLQDLIRGALHIEYERRTVTEISYKESILPSESVQIRTIKSLPEVVRALPGQLLLRSISNSLFWLKVINGSLLVAQPQEPQIVVKEEQNGREELVPVMKRKSPPRQKVYVLLDTSQSMEDANKLAFGKALILAYLLRASEEQAEIFFRHFRTVAFERIECRNQEDFPALAEYVLNLRADSSTNIGLAMKTAVDDIDTSNHLTNVRHGLSATAPAEILLISDCASYTGLPRIPNSIKLHTVHLEGGDEQSGTPLDYDSLVKEIRDRSETFVRINTSHLAMAPSIDEATAIRDEIIDLEEMLMAAGPEQARNDDRLPKRIEQVRRMAHAYRKMHHAGPTDVGAAQHLANYEMAENLVNLLTWEGVKESVRRMVEQASRARSAMFDNLRKLNQSHGGKSGGARFRIRGS